MNRIKIMVAGTANPHISPYLCGVGRNVNAMEVIAVSDFDDTRLDQAKKMLLERPQICFYSDYQAMFAAHPEADAVMIGSDNIDHFKMFQAAVAKKLHIYMMKVISMNEDECRRMVEIGRSYDRVVQCELELHSHPQFWQARHFVQSEALGTIKSIYLSNISQSPCNYFPNWGDPLLSYGKLIPIRPGSKVFRGGAITDHPHPFDLVRWITGHEFRTVSAISARNQRAHLSVEDHAAITGELDNGVKYFINPSYSNLEENMPARRLLWPKSLECNVKITGTKGYFSADFYDRHIYIVGNRCASPNRLIVDGTPRLSATKDHSLIGSFVDTIAGRRARPETTLEDDFAAIRVMNAAYESIYHNREIELSH
jgi:predicted dehydrogenase